MLQANIDKVDGFTRQISRTPKSARALRGDRRKKGQRISSNVDALDRKILEILQQDATATIAQISKKVGLSVTPCWKRIQKLESSGVIAKRVAILVPGKVGLGLTVYVNIQIDDHSPEGVEGFIKSVCAMPEVLECQRVAGAVDFFLRVVAIDVRHYEAFYRRLTGLMPLRGVSSYIAVQQMKSETALPLYLIAESSVRGEHEEDGVNS
jgi:Lrp/AsnC family transcriptional regulator